MNVIKAFSYLIIPVFKDALVLDYMVTFNLQLVINATQNVPLVLDNLTNNVLNVLQETTLCSHPHVILLVQPSSIKIPLIKHVTSVMILVLLVLINQLIVSHVALAFSLI